MNDGLGGGFGPVGQIPRHSFDSADFPPEARCDAYQELVGVAFEISDPGPDFYARLDTYRLDRMVLHASDVAALTFSRPLGRLRRDGLTHFALQAVIEGEIVGEFDGHAATVRAGEVHIVDLSRPFEMRTTAMRAVTLGLGQELMDPMESEGQDIHGLVLTGAAGRLLCDYLRSVSEQLPDLTQDALPGLTRATLALIESCLKGATDAAPIARGELDSLTLARARRHVQANLGSRELTPEAMASVLKVSRSTLYRLFAEFGGVSQYIWSQRLLRARALLSAGGGVPRMSELAYSLGFASEAHFSRAFRKAYGAPPSEFMNRRRDGARWDPDFARWVKDLS